MYIRDPGDSEASHLVQTPVRQLSKRVLYRTIATANSTSWPCRRQIISKMEYMCATTSLLFTCIVWTCYRKPARFYRWKKVKDIRRRNHYRAKFFQHLGHCSSRFKHVCTELILIREARVNTLSTLIVCFSHTAPSGVAKYSSFSRCNSSPANRLAIEQNNWPVPRTTENASRCVAKSFRRVFGYELGYSLSIDAVRMYAVTTKAHLWHLPGRLDRTWNDLSAISLQPNRSISRCTSSASFSGHKTATSPTECTGSGSSSASNTTRRTSCQWSALVARSLIFNLTGMRWVLPRDSSFAVSDDEKSSDDPNVRLYVGCKRRQAHCQI